MKALETSMTSRMAFFGDPHGDLRQIKTALKFGPLSSCFFLGDFDLDRPLDQEVVTLTDAGADVFFIHGNHDADRESWHDFVFESAISGQNISGRVVEAAGIKVAGMGGVFHEAVWHPKDGAGLPKFISRDEFLQGSGTQRWRGGLPLRHRSTIFREDFNGLANFDADILISHEAPSSHRYGYTDLDDLAEVLGAKLIIHGHLHQDYRATLPNGIKVIGLGKAKLLVATLDELLAMD